MLAVVLFGADCFIPEGRASLCVSVSLSSPSINTENSFYCKTHTENAYYFFMAIIACVAFFFSVSLSNEDARLQSLTASAMFILEHVIAHIQRWLLELFYFIYFYFARSHCLESNT